VNRTIALVGFAVISCATWAAGQAPSQQSAPIPAATHPLGTADASFVKQSEMGGTGEVELGQLSSSKAANDKVRKDFDASTVTRSTT